MRTPECPDFILIVFTDKPTRRCLIDCHSPHTWSLPVSERPTPPLLLGDVSEGVPPLPSRRTTSDSSRESDALTRSSSEEEENVCGVARDVWIPFGHLTFQLAIGAGSFGTVFAGVERGASAL